MTTLNIIQNIIRHCVEKKLSDKIKKELLYYIKLPPLLNSFNTKTSIKEKINAYNLYYKLIKDKVYKK